MYRACELKDQTLKKIRSFHFPERRRYVLEFRHASLFCLSVDFLGLFGWPKLLQTRTLKQWQRIWATFRKPQPLQLV